MTPGPGPTWGIVSTLRAPPDQVLDFAAWHLELGARRLYLHLDDPADPVFALLKAHPRIRPTRTDPRYWKRLAGHRPARHQPRQTANATRAYRICDVDWLAHIDVDEFLLPQARSVAAELAGLPEGCHCLRLRPAEALAPVDGPDLHLRAFPRDGTTRATTTARVYPEFGAWLNGGMLSHAAGKLFVHRGLPDTEFRIHNVFTPIGRNPGELETTGLRLAHLHARDWQSWLSHFRFRLARGAYRDELKPAGSAPDGANLHRLLTRLEATEGETGLRRFFDEVCADTPALRNRLRAEGLLLTAHMDLAALRARHFPGAAQFLTPSSTSGLPPGPASD